METASKNRTAAKVVVVGDAGVGKSSLIYRFVHGVFKENQTPTVGGAFFSHTMANDKDGSSLKLEIWDTAGQERFRCLGPMYYRASDAAIVVYDITNPHSFERAKLWMQELRDHLGPNTVYALVGNKIDSEAGRTVDAIEVQAYALQIEDIAGRFFFVETSARTAINVNELFYQIFRKLCKARAVHAQHSSKVLVAERSSCDERKRIHSYCPIL